MVSEARICFSRRRSLPGRHEAESDHVAGPQAWFITAQTVIAGALPARPALCSGAFWTKITPSDLTVLSMAACTSASKSSCAVERARRSGERAAAVDTREQLSLFHPRGVARTTRFVFLGAGIRLGLPSHPAPRRRSCLLLGVSTTSSSRGLSPPSDRPCRAYSRRRRLQRRWPGVGDLRAQPWEARPGPHAGQHSYGGRIKQAQSARQTGISAQASSGARLRVRRCWFRRWLRRSGPMADLHGQGQGDDEVDEREGDRGAEVDRIAAQLGADDD